jgi:hypothetical protein
MENGSDLSHTIRLIERYTADAKYARRQATTQRTRADQKYRENDSGTAKYFEQEADRDERHADELESHIDQLNNAKKRFEQRIAELNQQLANTAQDHRERIDQIKNEIAEVRGSGMML